MIENVLINYIRDASIILSPLKYSYVLGVTKMKLIIETALNYLHHNNKNCF
jgi:hypothetical protein